MRKTLFSSCTTLLLVLLASCSSGEKAIDSIEAGEDARSYVEAAMLEGRTAARSFLQQDVTDTMAMQQKLLEARTIQSRYIGKKEAAEAFDTAFIHTLRATRPELADSIENYYSR